MSMTLVPIALFLSLTFAIVGVARVISDGRTRRRLIESGASPELARAIMATPPKDVGLHGALKWGLVLGALGVALIVVQFMPYGEDDPITIGVVLLGAAAGLLGYYALGRRSATAGSDSRV